MSLNVFITLLSSLGAVAERVKLGSYMIFAVINTSLVYVFPCHWLWSDDGWLYGKALDFAGSSVVHMSGGAAALAGETFTGIIFQSILS